MPDLIRLIHGNIFGIKRLIKEFRLFWLQKTKSPSVCLDSSYEEELNESTTHQPADVSVADVEMKETNDGSILNKSVDASNSCKSKEEGHGCEISKRQLEIKIMAIAMREKRQCLKKIAWFVHDTVLSEFNMQDIQLPNTWVRLSSGPSISPNPKPQLLKEDDNNLRKDESVPTKTAPKDQRSIMDFTKTKEELEELRKSQSESLVRTQVVKEEDASLMEEDSIPVKVTSTDQKSITDFVKPKEELEASKKFHCTSLFTQRDSLTSHVKLSNINDQDNPRDKKEGSQRSIMEFTQGRTKANEVLTSKMEVDSTDVIIIEDDEVI